MLHLVYERRAAGESMPDIAATTLSMVERLYEAVAHAEAWPPFLDSLARAVGGVAPAVFVIHRVTDANLFHVSSGTDSGWGAAYETYFKHRDLRRARVKELHAAGTFVGSAILPDRELVRSEFYNEFLRPQGLFHLLGALAVKREDFVALVRVSRPRTAPPFGPQELALLRRLQPHLSRALRLQEQLALAEARRDEVGEVLDRFPGGVLLLDATGHVVAANRMAEQMLATGDGLRAGRDGIRAILPSETAALQRLIRSAAAAPSIDTSDGVLNVSRQPPRRPLNLLVAALRGGSLVRAARSAAVVVFVTDPDRPAATSVQRVQRWLGLTPAEAALVVELLQGKRVEEAAEALHISTHTARTQLKRALAKTGTGRQAELLRLALGTPVVLAG
jgi:DNA-binding CsgD family transcriptional regulator/PAS domain-containing protein